MDSAEAHGEAQPASGPADGQSGRRHRPLIAAFSDRCVLLFAGMLWFRLGPVTNVRILLSLCCFYSSFLFSGLHVTGCIFPFLSERSSQSLLSIALLCSTLCVHHSACCANDCTGVMLSTVVKGTLRNSCLTCHDSLLVKRSSSLIAFFNSSPRVSEQVALHVQPQGVCCLFIWCVFSY